jgi:hypothetical protein
VATTWLYLVRHALDAPTWRRMGLNQFNCALTILQVSTTSPDAHHLQRPRAPAHRTARPGADSTPHLASDVIQHCGDYGSVPATT